MIRLYSFNLEFNTDTQGHPLFATFPFMMDGLPAAEISCGISSRFAGDMAYSGENPSRTALFRALGPETAARVYGLQQIHSRKALVVDQHNPPDVPADGMVTADRGIVLSVTVADCLPVYLFDTETGAFGLLHSGWRGTGIVREALKLMAEHWRTRPEAVAAVLGPCIDSCCYEVDGERAAVFESEFGAVPPGLTAADAALLKPATRRDGNRCWLDLKAANVRLLAAAGVQHIAICGDCTVTDERLGSFRREGKNYTRMAALCGYY